MNMNRSKTKQSGSVILEALIAILIFSMGILALVGMQASAINNVADTKYRSTAGFLANQMIGTIWATRIGANVANASNVMAASPDGTFACNPCTINSASGNAYTRAWAGSSVTPSLPNSVASISIAGPMVTVAISWQLPAASAVHTHTVTSFVN